MTTGGRTPVLVGALLLIAGVVLAAPILLAPGLALLIGAALLTLGVLLAATGAAVQRSGLPAQVSEGEGFEVKLSGRGGLLPLSGRLADPALERPRSLRLLRPLGGFELRLASVMPRRGRHRLPPPEIRFEDPLGIASRSVCGEGSATVLVLPRIEPVSFGGDAGGPSIGRRGAAAGDLLDEGMRESAADPEIEGLRSYRPGTRASRIYWPALARGGELLERHLAPAADSGPLLVLDPSGAPGLDSLDCAVRAAASLAAHLGRRGGCELVIGSDHRRWRVAADSASLMGARTALALVESREDPPRLGRLAPGRALIWVSASGALPHGSGGSARGILVSPAGPPGQRALFTVAGCSGRSLGVSRSGRTEPRAAA